MNIASDELSYVCLFVGDWGGSCVEGCNDFWEEPYASETFESFAAFKNAFHGCIHSLPYVHFDSSGGQVSIVTDDYESENEVLELEMPDDDTLKAWYEELLSCRHED